MGLTRAKITNIDTTVEYVSDPITVLHAGSSQANVDVGFLINRANGLLSNTAIYWSESGNTFVTAFTSNTGGTDTNVAVTTYANITTGHHLPGANVTYDLGSYTQRWRTLYISGSTIVMGGATISTDNSGNFSFATAGGTSSNGQFATVISNTVNAVTIGNTGATLTGTLSTASQPSVTTLAGVTSLGTTGVTTTAAGNFTVSGNLTINGTTNTINNTVIEVTEYVQTIDATTVRAVTIGNIGANHVGTGTYLTSLNASNLSSGTVPLTQLSGITTTQLSATAGITNGQLANNSVTVTAGTGMSGGGAVALGSSITLTNAGVTGIAGTTNQITASASTGSVTLSLPTTVAINTLNAATIGNTGATLTGTLSTASQTSVTAVGNLTTLSVAGVSTHWGNMVAASGTTSTSTSTGALIVQGGAGVTGNIYVGAVYTTNGLFWAANNNVISTGGGGGSAPAGSSGQVQYNNGGTLGAVPMYYNSGNSTVTIPLTTSSTTTTSGALQIDGGVGIVGNLNAGVNGTSPIQHQILSGSQFAPTVGTFLAGAHTVLNGSGGNYLAIGQYPSGGSNQYGQWIQSGYPASSGAVYYPIILNPLGGNVVVASTTTSTSTTTGALVVSGGLGVAGSAYAGSVYDNGNRVLTSLSSSGAGNLTVSVSAPASTTIALPTTGPGAVTVGSSTAIPVITTDAYGRIATLTTASVSTTINLAGGTGTGSVAGGGTLTVSGGTGVTTSVTGSTFTITNSGVTSAVAGTGISVSGSTGAVTITNGGVTGLSSSGAGNLTVSASTGSITVALPATGPGTAAVGSSTAIPVITPDAYGRISTLTTAAVVAPAGTLSGSTLNSTVTASSLTSVGNLTSVSIAGTSSHYGVATFYSAPVPGANAAVTLGSATAWWSTVYGKAVQAQYADLAEHYTSDSEYSPGTVVVFGGEKEITVTTQSHDTRVAGIISTNPAYLMNAVADGLPVALTGRVPCFVQGPVSKGDVLVTSTTAGVAQRIGTNYQPGCVIGKALEAINTNTIETIEVVVGRF